MTGKSLLQSIKQSLIRYFGGQKHQRKVQAAHTAAHVALEKERCRIFAQRNLEYYQRRWAEDSDFGPAAKLAARDGDDKISDSQAFADSVQFGDFSGAQLQFSYVVAK